MSSDPQFRIEFRNPSPTPDYRAYAIDAIALVPFRISDPHPAAPPMIGMIEPGTLLIEGEAGLVHRIEYTDNLDSPEAWQPLHEFILSQSPHPFTDPGYGKASTRFYRVLRIP